MSEAIQKSVIVVDSTERDDGMAGLTKKVTSTPDRSNIAAALKGQFNMLHSMDFYDDYEIEEILLRQKQLDLSYIKDRFQLPEGMVQFSPSGADKCSRELFYKISKMPKDVENFPYRKRWTRNSTAVHEAVQRDLLYMNKHLKNPALTIDFVQTEFGLLPAWEKNIQKVKIFNHNGQTFCLYGMMDGILSYRDGSKVGFEFKTKSVMPDRVEKLKAPSRSHKLQTVAYSLLFDIDEYIIFYESVAKDEWRAGNYALDDIKPFYNKVTEKQRKALLDKMADVAEKHSDGEIPDRQTSKCMFCPYKSFCLEGMSNG
ncbi:PD-(D/E)XK nuclease family protein [Cytobacillus firmus]|nr:PD-(D/E)XK nuclease family protein [Cytobacillus firmus]